MKTVIELINEKIKEHKLEVDGCEKERLIIQDTLKNKDLMIAQKQNMGDLIKKSAALSYKYTFHNAAIQVMNDLLKELIKDEVYKNSKN